MTDVNFVDLEDVKETVSEYEEQQQKDYDEINKLKSENEKLWAVLKEMPAINIGFATLKDMRLWDSWKAKYRDILDVALEVSNDS